jgi:hypothetical protein
MDLKECELLDDEINDHWYYSSKSKALVKFIGKFNPVNIIDVGAGSGFFSKFLLMNTSLKEAWCFYINYSESYDLEYFEKKLILGNL